MVLRITSVIDIYETPPKPPHGTGSAENMNTRKHKHKAHKADTPKVVASPDAIVENQEVDKGKHYRSTAKSDKNRFFHGVETQNTNQGATQTVTVNVNIDQKDDCLTGCFSALAKCFGKGAAGAGGA